MLTMWYIIQIAVSKKKPVIVVFMEGILINFRPLKV